MLLIVLAVLSTTAIGLVFKLAEGRVSEKITLLLGNYIVAVLISFMFVVFEDGAFWRLSTPSLILGTAGGLVFAGNFFLMTVAVRKRGMALPVILMRLSAIVPILASIAFLGETPTILQYLGLAGAFCAAVLLSLHLRGGEAAKKKEESRLTVVVSSLGFLLCFGLADLSLRMFEELGRAGEKPFFLAFLFLVALGVFILAAWIRKTKIRIPDLLWGFGLGVPNMLAAYFVVSALREFPAFIVFPVVSAGTVVLVSILAFFLFGERIGRWGLAGIGLTVLSIAAINA